MVGKESWIVYFDSHFFSIVSSFKRSYFCLILWNFKCQIKVFFCRLIQFNAYISWSSVKFRLASYMKYGNNWSEFFSNGQLYKDCRVQALTIILITLMFVRHLSRLSPQFISSFNPALHIFGDMFSPYLDLLVYLPPKVYLPPPLFTPDSSNVNTLVYLVRLVSLNGMNVNVFIPF